MEGVTKWVRWAHIFNVFHCHEELHTFQKSKILCKIFCCLSIFIAQAEIQNLKTKLAGDIYHITKAK